MGPQFRAFQIVFYFLEALDGFASVKPRNKTIHCIFSSVFLVDLTDLMTRPTRCIYKRQKPLNNGLFTPCLSQATNNHVKRGRPVESNGEI